VSARLTVREAAPSELQFLRHFAAVELAPDARGMAAVDSKGRIRAMVGYERFTAESCHVHQAGVTIAARSLVPACFIFPFVGLGLKAIHGSVCSNNARALRMNARLGFRVTGLEKDAFGPGLDRVDMEMRREDCRWLPKGVA
jgi:RimJ/RimL family protein N-acetyltransferase